MLPETARPSPTSAFISSRTRGAGLTDFSLASAQVAKSRQVLTLTWPRSRLLGLKGVWPGAGSSQVMRLEKARSGGIFFKRESLILTARQSLLEMLLDLKNEVKVKLSSDSDFTQKWLFTSNQMKPRGAWDCFPPYPNVTSPIKKGKMLGKPSSTSNGNLRAFSGDLNASETSGLNFTQILHNLNN